MVNTVISTLLIYIPVLPLLTLYKTNKAFQCYADFLNFIIKTHMCLYEIGRPPYNSAAANPDQHVLEGAFWLVFRVCFKDNFF